MTHNGQPIVYNATTIMKYSTFDEVRNINGNQWLKANATAEWLLSQNKSDWIRDNMTIKWIKDNMTDEWIMENMSAVWVTKNIGVIRLKKFNVKWLIANLGTLWVSERVSPDVIRAALSDEEIIGAFPQEFVLKHFPTILGIDSESPDYILLHKTPQWIAANCTSDWIEENVEPSEIVKNYPIRVQMKLSSLWIFENVAFEVILANKQPKFIIEHYTKHGLDKSSFEDSHFIEFIKNNCSLNWILERCPMEIFLKDIIGLNKTENGLYEDPESGNI